MDNRLLLVVSLWLVGQLNCFCQSIGEYSFSDYPAPKTNTQPKAKIDYDSHKIARQFKTAITDTYRLADVNFAGHYIVCTWGCGTGCLDGAMVDIRTGKVYKLPMGETRYYFGCSFENDEDCMEFLQDSRLFITEICMQQERDKQTDEQQREYFVNIWNEDKKRFEFVTSFKRQKIVGKD